MPKKKSKEKDQDEVLKDFTRRLENALATALNGRPNVDDWRKPSQAAEDMDLSIHTVREYIAKGVFISGTELKVIGPNNAKRLTYRINVREYYRRTEAEQTAL